jgi:hypothetical protein
LANFLECSQKKCQVINYTNIHFTVYNIDSTAPSSAHNVVNIYNLDSTAPYYTHHWVLQKHYSCLPKTLLFANRVKRRLGKKLANFLECSQKKCQVINYTNIHFTVYNIDSTAPRSAHNVFNIYNLDSTALYYKHHWVLQKHYSCLRKTLNCKQGDQKFGGKSAKFW